MRDARRERWPTSACCISPPGPSKGAPLLPPKSRSTRAVRAARAGGTEANCAWARLKLSGCPHLNTDAALAPLAHWGASLTSLMLMYCDLPGRLPAPLSALSALRSLVVDLEAERASKLLHTSLPPAADAFAPLACLSALTRLVLYGGGCPVLPAELSTLHGLKVCMPAACSAGHCCTWTNV